MMKKLSCLICSFPDEFKQSNTLPYFSSHGVNNFFVWGMSSVMFFAFLCFMLVVLLFKLAPSIVLKYCLVFLSVGSLWCTLQRKFLYKIRFIQAWVDHAAGHEFNVNESIIYTKVFLNRNTHKTRSYIYHLMKVLWPEAHRNLALCFFPRSSDFSI